MTEFAVGKIAASKGAFVVMASHTFHRAARRKMLGGNGRTDLSGLRRAGYDRMTIGAIEPLTRAVVGVRETCLKRRRAGRSPPVTGLRMTHTARTDVLSADKTIRRMTRIALIMRVEADRN